jgi:hypothetical protein
MKSELYGLNANKKRFIIQVSNLTALCLASLFNQQTNLVCDYMNKKRDNSQTEILVMIYHKRCLLN